MTSFRVRCRTCIAAALLLASGESVAQSTVLPQIGGVYVEPQPVGASNPREFVIDYQLSEAVGSMIRIYDDRNLLVRSIPVSARSSRTPRRSVHWDGRDDRRNPVPAEAYYYRIEAQDGAGHSVSYDVTDVTGTETVEVGDVRWNPATRKIHYRINRPARVSLRVGLPNGGPLLATILSWVPRRAGEHEESWDGWDASRAIEIGKHPSVTFGAQAFALPDNAIVVGAPLAKSEWVNIPAKDRVERVSSRREAKQMYAHWQQSAETRGDVGVRLVLPPAPAVDAAGVPVLSGKVPIRLEVDRVDVERLLSRRFEPVFYVDGLYVFENEVGYLPMTWVFDTATVNPGPHYVSVNLRGYEGNFGVATVKINVRRDPASP